MKNKVFRLLSILLVVVMLASVSAFAADSGCDHQWVNTGESTATCKEAGYQPQTCSVCGSTRNKYVPATGLHSWVDDGTPTAATCTEPGYQPQFCSVCGSTRKKPIPATGHTASEPVKENVSVVGGSYDLVVYCAVCGAELSRTDGSTPVLPPAIGAVLPMLGEQVASPFVDVAPMDYCYDAVNWAVENEITAGTGPLTFSPDDPCTRAQAVTFLWRAVGSPAPASTKTAFTDVDTTAYYAKAVAWAVETGITGGTTPTTFSPNAPCTRAQIVTFLYRAMGDETGAVAAFTDVALDAYYAPAVAWAAASGVTGGTTPTTFSPGSVCTRAQIVTFLYRACAN